MMAHAQFLEASPLAHDFASELDGMRVLGLTKVGIEFCREFSSCFKGERIVVPLWISRENMFIDHFGLVQCSVGGEMQIILTSRSKRRVLVTDEFTGSC